MYTLKLYSDVSKFILEEPPEAKDVIEREIRRLQNNSLRDLVRLYPKAIKCLRRHLYELRIIVANVLYRILFTFANSVIWLLVAFKKGGRKTPLRHIKTALNRIKNIK